ncbi:MAG: hypothetical protein AVDCRST_MAG55-2512, partial [uncultured Rubrobacteraceae bacterium]
ERERAAGWRREVRGHRVQAAGCAEGRRFACEVDPSFWIAAGAGALRWDLSRQRGL